MQTNESAEKNPGGGRPSLAAFTWLGRSIGKRIGEQRSSDIIVAAIGITLGLTCAMFPWYVFFNQEKFGIRAVQFSGSNGADDPPENLTYQPSLVGQRIVSEDIPLLQLDQIATGTVPDAADSPASEVPLSAQPFPGDETPIPEYRLVYIANGRAMIEDKEGLFLVKAGSILPDKSRVASIEQRDRRWVVITSNDKVLALAN